MDYMQRNVVTSATSVKPLLEGGCDSGCSLSDEGGMLMKFSLPRGATSQLHFRLPRLVNACPKTGTRPVDAIPCLMDGGNVVTAIVPSS